VRTRLVSVLSLTAALAAGPLAATAAADTPALPAETGCAGGQLLSVADLESQGYPISFIDAEGNNDGYLCGVPLPEAFRAIYCPEPCPVPVIYKFRDNDLPPYQG
jgi:hypothetical protein